MKRRIIIGVVLLAPLIAAALTTRWWLAHLLNFVDAKANTIQALSSLVQLLLWGGAAVLTYWRFFKPPKPAEPANAPVAIDDTVLHQLPPVLADFTNRVAEVDELRDKLDGNTSVYGLFGMGGIGKSDLAKKFAETHLSERYPDAQLYVDLEGSSRKPKSVSEAQRHIISSCHGSEKLSRSEGVNLAGKYYDALHKRRALLFLDNAASSEQVEALMPPAGCAMLVTSRQKIVLGEMHAMTLKPLAIADARALLLRIAPRIGDHADEIAALCDGLPRALRFAATTIAKYDDLPVEEYVSGLRDRKTRLQLVDASLQYSYDLLSPPQQRQFCRLSIFPETFDAEAAAAVWGQSLESARVDLREFLGSSLVEWHEQARRYRMHSLVRDFADEHINEAERDDAQARHTNYYLKVLRDAGEQYLQGHKFAENGRRIFDLERANIQTAQNAVQNQLATPSVAELARASYSYGAAQLLVLKQSPAARIEWHQALLNALQASSSNSKESELAKAGNLTFIGVAHRDLGAYDQTIKHCEEAAKIAQQLNEPRAESAAWTYAGIAYYYTGEYQTASTNIQQAIDISNKAQHREVLDDIERLRYLGHSQRGLGKFDEAISAYKGSLQHARAFGDVIGENSALNALGRSHCDIGQHELARTEYLLPALKLATETGSSREECYSLAHLGHAHRDLGLYDEARRYYGEALKLAVPLGHRQLETYCNGGLGKTDLAVGDAANALSHAEQAVKLADKIKMKRAQQFWRTLVAQTLLLTQDLDGAERIAKEALSYDSEWVNYFTLTLQGLALAKRGQTQPAASVFEKAATEAEQLLTRAPAYFDARYCLGLAKCGLAVTKPDEANGWITQSTAVFEQAYQNCKSQGILDEALRLFEEVAALNVNVDLAGPRKVIQHPTSG
jgi:tetratricopeptide (TPR) repeat protein